MLAIFIKNFAVAAAVSEKLNLLLIIDNIFGTKPVSVQLCNWKFCFMFWFKSYSELISGYNGNRQSALPKAAFCVKF